MASGISALQQASTLLTRTSIKHSYIGPTPLPSQLTNWFGLIYLGFPSLEVLVSRFQSRQVCARAHSFQSRQTVPQSDHKLSPNASILLKPKLLIRPCLEHLTGTKYPLEAILCAPLAQVYLCQPQDWIRFFPPLPSQ